MGKTEGFCEGKERKMCLRNFMRDSGRFMRGKEGKCLIGGRWEEEILSEGTWRGKDWEVREGEEKEEGKGGGRGTGIISDANKLLVKNNRFPSSIHPSFIPSTPPFPFPFPLSLSPLAYPSLSVGLWK